MNKKEVIELDDNNWEKIVEKSNKPVVVLFFSDTCPYCKQIEPSFFEYAIELKDKIQFGRLNVLRSQTIPSRYGVMGIPTFKFFCKGKPVQELVGAIHPTILKKTVEESLLYGSECANKTTWIDPGINGYA
jgi:thioredoxin-like negative regulator of GroEL